MKGIYLTEEGKQEIEAKIAELQHLSKIESSAASLLVESDIATYKQILASATILPVEESWDEVGWDKVELYLVIIVLIVAHLIF